jgi:ribokinase
MIIGTGVVMRKRLVVVCQSGEMAFDVVVVGSANLDLVAQLDRLPLPGETLRANSYAEYAGGKGLNQAVACARMGARTAFVGCLGNDDAGAFLRTVLESEGIDSTNVKIVEAPTGRAFINVDAHGENAIVVISGANAMVGSGGTALQIPAGKIVLAQLEVPQSVIALAFSQAYRQGSQTVLNPAPSAPLSMELLRATDVIVPNETESVALGGTDVLLEAGVGTIVVTQGEYGAEIISKTELQHIDAFAVTPIDTVGAGDAFIGAMCAELARGASLQEACQTASVAGALATTVRGAVPSLPTRAAVIAAQGKHQ